MRRVILAIVSTAAALVFLLTFKTHTASTTTGASSAVAGASPGAGTGTASGPAASGTPASSGSAKTAGPTASAAGSGAARTVTGEAWPTIYGPVQVRITVAGSRITAVTALEYPTNTPRDEQINAFAIPELNQETLAASSARIDAVSGATYTSQGYIGSLQSAVDKAGL
jgi:uncharacterized protein with FMN-binding domain